MNITPVNALKLQTGTLSNYAQRFMKSQAKSTSFALERFFLDTEPELISQNEQKLKAIGVKQIGKDVKEGILVTDNEYDYRMFVADDGNMGFDIFEPDSSLIIRQFSLNNKSDKYTHAGDFTGLSIEDEMSRVLDFASSKIYKIKRECVAQVPKPFIQGQQTADKIAELNKVLQTTRKNPDIKESGFIGSDEEEMIDSINEKFRLTQELYKKISDCRTKWEVKKSYPNYLPQPVTNKLGFKDIGPNGESVTFFRTSHKNNVHNAIIVTDKDGSERIFVISQNEGSVQKNLPSKFVNSGNSEYRVHIAPDYYTQKEVDESNLPVYLACFNEEMGKFIEHTQGWFDKKEEMRLIRANHDSATLEPYKELLDDIHTSFESYRTKMRKHMRKPHQNKPFRAENGISQKLTSTAVKFDNITPDGYDLRLSYPKVRDKVATQLLVMRGDKVENSFYIINDKLLRFEIKDTNDKITHNNRKFYYHDKKYLESSNLESYLLLLRDKLHELNKKLDIIRKKQLENKAKYHIKTKEEMAQ